MTRLTDEQLAELVEPKGSDGFGAWQEYQRRLFDFAPAILAELCALRKLREAAEVMHKEWDVYEPTFFGIKELFAALDEARGAT